MIIKKTFAMAVAAVALLASCSKENNESPGIQNGTDAMLKIAFEGSVPPSKAFDGANAGVGMYDATIFVFNADGAIQKKIYVPNSDISLTAKEYKVTTAADKVAVIANAGDLTSVAAVNLTQLNGVLAELKDLDKTKVWMSKMSNVLTFNDVSDKKVATVNLTLDVIPSKVDVTVTNSMTNKDDAEAIQMQGVALLYSAGYTSYLAPYIPAAAPATKMYYRSGVDTWTGSGESDEVLATLDKSWTTPSTTPFTETFYALPGNGSDSKNTIVAAYGTHNGTTYFFPVVFNTDDKPGAVFGNGKHYKVTITLKGDAKLGGGGTTDPEIPVLDAYINVTVGAGSWESVSEIIKDFE